MSGLNAWINKRFPLDKMMKEHVTEYYASKNLNIWYAFGVLALVLFCKSDRHWNIPDYELQTIRYRSIRFR